MSGHTPGPWFTHPKWRRICAHGKLDFVISDSPEWRKGMANDEDLANLRLIAAAPDLLAALQHIHAHGYTNSADFGMVRAAITEATGAPA